MNTRVRIARSCAWLVVLAAAAAHAGAEWEAFAVNPGASHVRIHLGRTGLLKFLGHEHHIEAPIAEGRVEVVEDEPARSSVTLRFESVQLALIPGSEPAGDIPKVAERMRHGLRCLPRSGRQGQSRARCAQPDGQDLAVRAARWRRFPTRSTADATT